jgi:hypothetical protein
MKRQLFNNNDNTISSKRRKLNNTIPSVSTPMVSTPMVSIPYVSIDWNKMIPASYVRNYMLNDPLLDYLKEYKITSIDVTPQQINRSSNHNSNSNSNSNSNHNNFDLFTKNILDAGVKFENELIKIVQQKHPVVKVAEHYDSKNIDKFNETVQHMLDGKPIIYQALLHNYENQTYGIPDLLVRSDYMNTLFGYEVLTDEEAKRPSPKLCRPYHYIVIDIKHSTIHLRADNKHILNSDNAPAYKGQLYIYTLALNNILGIDFSTAYIWGKRYNYECKNIKYDITNFMNKLGKINYDTVDKEYKELTMNAVEWLKDLRSNGHQWNLLPIPCKEELYPNMKNDKDSNYKQIKNQLSEKIFEITNVWQCGYNRRKIAHRNKIFSWNNPNCTAKNMGFNPSKTASTVDAILDINRQVEDIIRPQHVSYDRAKWFDKNSENNCEILDFYLDFETLNSNFGSSIKNGEIMEISTQLVFMIGIGYNKNGNWKFKSFIMKSKSNKSEQKMFTKFYKYINKILVKNNKSKARFYHWSSAEVSMYNTFKSKATNVRNMYDDSKFEFYDLLQVFINEPIVVKGALNFSLKSVATALEKNKLIESKWDKQSQCSNGLNAMILAQEIYNLQSNKSTECIKNNSIMQDIAYYNEIDCKVMWEIHEFMRNNL